MRTIRPRTSSGDDPLDGGYVGAGREDARVERVAINTELVDEQSLEQTAHVEARRSVAVLEQFALGERRPVADDAAALQRPAEEQRGGGGAVVGAGRAVDPRGAAELGDHHDGGVLPALAHTLCEAVEHR